MMFKNIDPIVLPGQYTSHMHSFFGSDAIAVNTTTSTELQKGCSTTENPNDFSTYWVPTLYLVGNDGKTYRPIVPMRFSAYYEQPESAEIAIPQNKVEADAGISWFCGGNATDESKDAAAFPTTTYSTHLQTLLHFHDCVNPGTLERAYLGNPRLKPGYGDNWCPSDIKRIPQLRFSIRYDLRKLLSHGWSGAPPLAFACGSLYCTHGDFIDGWLPEAAESMVQDAAAKYTFFAVDGPLGDASVGSVCGAENAKDSDPTLGTSDYFESLRMMGNLVTKAQRNFKRRH